MGAVATSPRLQMPRRSEPMAGAYFALLLFVIVYCGRPEDWIPGLHFIPLGKTTGVIALFVFFLSARSRPGGLHLPRELVYLILLLAQFTLASVLSPVWKGGAVQKTIDFAKVVVIVLLMMLTVITLARLRRLIFVQAISVAAVTFISIVAGHFDRYGRLQG